MKSTTTQALVLFGVILLVLAVIGVYMLQAGSYGSEPAPSSDSVTMDSGSDQDSETQDGAQTDASADMSTEEDAASGGFELSSAQVEALVSLGIDPADVPSSVSAAQETCFVEALGEERVEEIKAGAVPGTLEFLKAKSCV